MSTTALFTPFSKADFSAYAGVDGPSPVISRIRDTRGNEVDVIIDGKMVVISLCDAEFGPAEWVTEFMHPATAEAVAAEIATSLLNVDSADTVTALELHVDRFHFDRTL